MTQRHALRHEQQRPEVECITYGAPACVRAPAEKTRAFHKCRFLTRKVRGSSTRVQPNAVRAFVQEWRVNGHHQVSQPITVASRRKRKRETGLKKSFEPRAIDVASDDFGDFGAFLLWIRFLLCLSMPWRPCKGILGRLVFNRASVFGFLLRHISDSVSLLRVVGDMC